MIKGWYPRSANTTDLYVYLNSLSGDNSNLYNAAKSLISAQGIIDNPKEGYFLQSLNFLKTAAASERAKEINFLRNKGYDIIVDENFNYLDFIKKINQQISDEKEFIRRIEIEKNRFGKQGEGSHSYTQAMGSYVMSIKRQLEGGKRRMTRISGVVRSALIKLAKQKLKNVSSIDEIAGILGMMQSQLMPLLTQQMTNDGSLFEAAGIKKEFINPKSNTINQAAVEDLIKKTDIYKQIFEKSSTSELEMMAKNLLSKYSTTLTNEAKKVLRKVAKKELESYKNKKGYNWVKIAKEFDLTPYLKDLNADNLYTYTFEKNTGMGGEGQNYIDLIKQNFITSWTGSAGGKADTVSLYGNMVLTENKKISDTFLNNIVGNITNKTQSHFQEINNEMQRAYSTIDKELQILSKDSNELKNAFLLHTSVKDYMTTGTDSFKGFKGGEYQGLSIIESLSSLSEAGFSSVDIDWLRVCLLNTAEEAVGGSNKSSLERYISVFASMLLFDDGAIIAQQASENLKLTNLNVLHLFMLNGIYVPASYIMETIAEKLSSSAIDAENAIKVNISPGGVNFEEELENLTNQEVWNYHRWRSISNTQIEAMEVKIKFLLDFKDLINNLGKILT